MIASLVAKTNADATILDITAATGLTITSWTRSGITYRAQTVEYDDVPGETTVQSVKAAENLIVAVTITRDTLAEALDALEVVTDAVCDPDLRTFRLVITYNSDRIETWTVLRPADCTAPEMDPAAGQGSVSAALTFRVNPEPTVTYVDTYES